MRAVAVVQARMGSSRLPGKALKRVGGRSILAHVLERAASIPGVDAVAVTTTPEREDDHIVRLAAGAGVACTTGQVPLPGQPGHRDVLAGYVEAAREVGADAVVRITGDCPLLDPAVAGLVLKALFDSPGAIYASNVHPPSWFDGCDAEAFTVEALLRAHHDAAPDEREHVTTHLWRNWGKDTRESHTVNVRAPGGLDVSALKLSVDDRRDLERVRRVHAALPRPGAFGWRDTLEAYRRAFPSYAEVRARELYGDGRSHGAESLRRAFVAGVESVAGSLENPHSEGGPLAAAWDLGRSDAARLGYA